MTAKSNHRRSDLYRYAVVSCNGHGIHGPQFKRFRDARAHAENVADRGTGVVLGPFEVQRVEYVDHLGGSRRYSMRQRSRWVPWDHKRDHTVRRPDFLVFEPYDPTRPQEVDDA